MDNFRARKASEPYQELEECRGADLNNATQQTSSSVTTNNRYDYNVDRSLELASVSVIPDGEFWGSMDDAFTNFSC